MKRFLVVSGLIVLLGAGSFTEKNSFAAPTAIDTVLYPDETHFKNVQQLTFGGDNAEAYWSFNGKYLVFQRTSVKDGVPCDQIFMGPVPKMGEAFNYKIISSGKGRTTCAFFTGDNKHIIYASTHKGSVDCPPVPDRAKYGNRYI